QTTASILLQQKTQDLPQGEISNGFSSSWLRYLVRFNHLTEIASTGEYISVACLKVKSTERYDSIWSKNGVSRK
uniref:Uncharacterized protein n=1 Tax=Oryza brachyantha TaxID=4533 RepID=J3LZ27_ORYBR